MGKKGATVRVCVVCCGDAKRHEVRLRTLADNSNMRLVAVVDYVDESTLADDPSVSNDQPSSDSEQKMETRNARRDMLGELDCRFLKRKIEYVHSLAEVNASFDAVVILADVLLDGNCHAQIVKEAAEYTQFIFCLPPITMNIEALRELTNFCSQRGVELICGYHARFDNKLRELSDNISCQRLVSGEIISSYNVTSPILSAKEFFINYMANDFDKLLMLMDEQMPMVVQAIYIQNTSATVSFTYPGGKIVTIKGYINTHTEHVVRMHCANGFYIDTKMHEQHYDTIYAACLRDEIEFFRRMCCRERAEPMFDSKSLKKCIQLANLATQSVKENGKKMNLMERQKMRLLQIGNGSFGKHIQFQVLANAPFVDTVAIVTRANSHKLESFLKRKDIDAVYVCLPYHLHSAVVEKCLLYEKKVLCEKPLLEFGLIKEKALKHDRFLMVGFHRRFDRQFQKLRERVKEIIVEGQTIDRLIIESKDIGDCSPDIIDILQIACIHDFDMVSWLFEDFDSDITIEKMSYDYKTIDIELKVRLKKYDTEIKPQIHYERGHSTYVQKVYVNSFEFGYDYSGEAFYNCFNDAYRREFKFFYSQPVVNKGNGQYVDKFSRTNRLLEEACEMVIEESNGESLNIYLKHSENILTPFAHSLGQKFFVKASKIYKPLLYVQNELGIIEKIIEECPEMKVFLPKVTSTEDINGIQYLVFEDFTNGYSHARIIDIQIGHPSHDSSIKMRPFGLHVSSVSGQSFPSYEVHDRTALMKMLNMFITPEAPNSFYEVIPELIGKLQALQQLLQKHLMYKFRSVSLLMIFNASGALPYYPPSILLMNYAKIKPHTTIDHYLNFGLLNLIEILHDIHEFNTAIPKAFFVRHGFRYDYEDLDWVPNSPFPHDPPLSESGLIQARDVALRMKLEKIDVIVTSPFHRAVQMARIMSETINVPYVVEPAYGEFLSVNNRRAVPDLNPESSEPHPYWNSAYKPYGKELTLETWETMQIRVHNALTYLMLRYKRPVIISHRSSLQAIFSVIVGKKWKYPLEFASVTTVVPSESNPCGFELDRLNLYDHLTLMCESPYYNPNYARMSYKDMIIDQNGFMPNS